MTQWKLSPATRPPYRQQVLVWLDDGVYAFAAIFPYPSDHGGDYWAKHNHSWPVDEPVLWAEIEAPSRELVEAWREGRERT